MAVALASVINDYRTPNLFRTDLLLSHELRLGGGSGGGKRLRFELNVLNVFNQKTATHIYNYLNKGGIIPDRTLVVHRPVPDGSVEGLRLQGAHPAVEGRRDRVRRPLRNGRPVSGRRARLLHREVPVLTVGDSDPVIRSLVIRSLAAEGAPVPSAAVPQAPLSPVQQAPSVSTDSRTFNYC